MDDVGDVEEMEDRVLDRVLDLVFALGGRATIWRSYADHDPSRVVRGLMIEMAPGQDTFSLLVSPEGHLTPVFQIEEAEEGAFAEPPHLFVKSKRTREPLLTGGVGWRVCGLALTDGGFRGSISRSARALAMGSFGGAI